MTAFSDSFTGVDGDPPNEDSWSVHVDGANTLSLDSNRLKHVSVSGEGMNEARSKFTLSGDFDVQIDFDVTSSAAGDTWGCGLQFIMGTDIYQVYIQVGASTKHYGMNHYLSGVWADSGTSPTTDNTGKVRMTRSGSTFTGYYWNGSAWVSIASHDYVSAPDIDIVKCYSNSWDTKPGFITYHDNFVVNSGLWWGLSDMKLDIALYGNSLADLSLDIHMGAIISQDAPLSLEAYYQALGDSRIDADVMALVFENEALDIFAALRDLENVCLGVQLAEEVTKDNALLDLYCSDGYVKEDSCLDLYLGDGVKRNDFGLTISLIEQAPVFEAVYAMHLNSAIKEI